MFSKIFEEKPLTVLTLLIVATLFFLSLQATWPFIVDDSYITLRYAKHLAEGYGITWNIGQPPLEGYSNFSYLILAALLYYTRSLFHLHYTVIELIRYFSIGCLILTALTMYRTVRLLAPPYIALLPLIMLFSYPASTLWAGSGLETAFFQLLITSTVYYLCKAHKTPENLYTTVLAGFFIAFASLTRPEGVLFFLLFGGGLFYLLNTEKPPQNSKLRPLILYFLAFLSIYTPYFISRWVYFGHLFPNPVYCKFMHHEKPWMLLLEYSRFAIPLLLLSIPACFMKASRCYFILPAIACFFMLYGVDPIVGYFNRYALPFLSLLMISAILGLFQLHQMIQHETQGKFQNKGYLLIATLIFSFLFLYHPSYKEYEKKASFYHRKNVLRDQVSQWFHQNSLPTSSIVVEDCGIIPLSLNQTEIIDSLCLNSREMTSSSIHQSYKKFVQWVLYKKKPDYIILTQFTWKKSDFLQPFEQTILKRHHFLENYQLIKNFSLNPEDLSYQYNIYKRI